MYPLTVLADLIGVPVETLTDWEQRYGVGRAAQESTRQRPARARYSDAQVQEFAAVAALVDAGSAPVDAAAEVRRRRRAGLSLFALDRPAPTRFEGRGLDPLTATLLTQAQANRRASVRPAVAEAWRRFGPEEVADGWSMPTLAAVGVAWEAGELSVAAEHLISHEIRASFGRDMESARGGAQGPGAEIVLATASGVAHDIGLWALGAQLARRGISARCLENEAGDDDVVAALTRLRARHVVLAATRLSGVAPTLALMARLQAEVDDLTIWVGGAQEDRLAPPGRPLGPSIRGAADLLVPVLRSPARPGSRSDES